ncbi:MAG: acyl-CoA thioesterase [Pseudomonadota bacterium]
MVEAPASLQDARETHSFFVSPGMCDLNGHLNTMFYTQAFDAASWRFFSPYEAGDTDLGWADVRHEVTFKAEMMAGTSATITSEIVRVGRTSIVTKHVMHNGEGEVAAEAVYTSVRFDLKKRCAVPIEDSFRA